MSIFHKLSLKFGLTDTELKVNLFLVVILVAGIYIKVFNWEIDEPVKTNFDYSKTDSIFYSAAASNNAILENKAFDSKLESSDFNKGNFNTTVKKPKLAEKSINLNTAGLEELAVLPGIGIKTAEKILAYRRASGGFRNIYELMEVKGIGDSKFEKIKKYIFIR